MSGTYNTTMTVDGLYSGVTDGGIVSDIALQREIVYDAEKQALVIDSILRGIPLPAFYLWRNAEGVLEVLDGKQRIEAIRKFRQNDLQHGGRIWKEIGPEAQGAFNATELSVIVCEGDEALKLETFRRINTLGVPLNQYEVLNGLYHGEYLEGLTGYANQPAVARVLGGNARGRNQVHLLRWLMTLDGRRGDPATIAEHVRERRDSPFDADRDRLQPHLRFIREVFTCGLPADACFQLSRRHLRDLSIWKAHRDAINKAVTEFRRSDDYRLCKDRARETEDRILAVVKGVSVDPRRFFTADDKAALLAMQAAEDGRYACGRCGQHFAPDELTVDHVTPWSLGGRTVLSNAMLLCAACNSSKGNR